ncbi:hypothetical protein A9C19_09035 [Bacillus weihaiensis]|uniref:Uncharacterized protein n=2 Tax=Bacillus weihaiensis TaxID=1547283 RepID=A0A1L3MXF9_9BACI|nr:hypothetical protein A9C19_09035 [Bacillus weihaiensis]
MAILLVCFYFFFGFRDSVFYKGFPIPIGATLTHEDSSMKVESYEWWAASEENGLPFNYLIMIRLYGWTPTEVVGSMTVYEKGDHQVAVISQEDYLGLSPRD